MLNSALLCRDREVGWCDSVRDLCAVFGIKDIMERSQNKKIDWHGVEGQTIGTE